MVGLCDGGKTLRICVTVYTQYRRVTDGLTDRQTDILPRHSPRYAYASRGKNQSKFATVISIKWNTFLGHSVFLNYRTTVCRAVSLRQLILILHVLRNSNSLTKRCALCATTRCVLLKLTPAGLY